MRQLASKLRLFAAKSVPNRSAFLPIRNTHQYRFLRPLYAGLQNVSSFSQTRFYSPIPTRLLNTPPEPNVLRCPEEYDSTIPNVNLAQFVLEKIANFADDVAIVNGENERTFTYSQISRIVNGLAAGLQTTFGVKQGKLVAVALPVSMEYGPSVLAINLCGSTATLINPTQTIEELEHCQRLAPPDVWIGTEAFYPMFHKLYAEYPEKPQFISIDGPSGDYNWYALAEKGVGQSVEPIDQSKLMDLDALIMFSSGTTGLPKGVVLTNFNIVTTRCQAREVTKWFERNESDAFLIFSPLYHVAALCTVFECLQRGLRLVLLPKFSLDGMFRTIEQFKITASLVVPALAARMIKEPIEGRYDLSSLMLIRIGAAAAGKDMIEQMMNKFSCLVTQMYGLTEATLVSHGNTITHNREGSIGCVLPFCEAKICDPNSGQALGVGQEGEICIRGPTIMRGYIGDQSATSSVIDSHGWLHTGDIGYYDEDGFFYVTDRMKELIKFKGLQVAPTELEHVLLTHPDVIEAAVTGIPDLEAGEVPRAYVVRRPGSNISERELIEFVSGKLSQHKQLRGGVVFIPVVPRTSTGKILRRQLAKLPH